MRPNQTKAFAAISAAVTLGAITVAVAFASLVAAAAPAPPSPRVVRFLGERAAQVLPRASRAEVFVLSPKRAQDDEPGVGGYRIEKTLPAQGEPFARKVADLLLDERSYRFDQSKVGGFAPRLGIRLWDGERRVEVVVSLPYDELVVFSPNPDDGTTRSAQADVVPAREALRALVKELLPEG